MPLYVQEVLLAPTTNGRNLIAPVGGATVGLDLGASALQFTDLQLIRDAADVLAQRRGVNGQASKVYHTYTDASNYERLSVGWDAGFGWFSITTEKAGTGTAQALVLNTLAGSDIAAFSGGHIILDAHTAGTIFFKLGGTNRWAVDNGNFSSNLGALVPAANNAYELGSATNTVKTGYFGTSVIAPVFTANLGASTGTMNGMGRANTQTSAAGVGNGADTTDDTLFTYSLPLNALSAAGKSLRVRAWGTFAGNADTKAVKLWFAGTALVNSGVLTLSGKNWTIEYEVTAIDATHVSTIGSFMGDTASVQDVTTNANLVVADLTANASVIKVTGASTIAGAAGDVLGYGMKVWFEN